jgi:hypothetical protein
LFSAQPVLLEIPSQKLVEARFSWQNVVQHEALQAYVFSLLNCTFLCPPFPSPNLTAALALPFWEYYRPHT